MNKKELIQFLTDKPGYLKKGNHALRTILSQRGKTINLPNTEINKIKKSLKTFGLKSNINCKSSNQITPKRLFYDIETSYNVTKSWRIGGDIRLNPGDIIHERAIICVSYKWEGKDKVHTLKWKDGCDKDLVKNFLKVMDEADELVGHNIDRYDTKFVRTRALLHGFLTLPKYTSYDTLKQARKHFSLNSNKLDFIARKFGFGGKVKHAGLSMWDDIVLNAVFGMGKKSKAKKSLKKMIKYCEGDVILTEMVYNVLRKHTERNTHHGAINGRAKFSCPNCGSENAKAIKTLTSKTGMAKVIMECQDCGERFILSNTNYLKLIK